MNKKCPNHYHIIEQALRFLVQNWQEQPSLDDLAGYCNLSPFYLQKIFIEWVGLSPKKFLQFLSLSSARSRLIGSENLLSAAYGSALSGPGRLHDLMIQYEAMTPGDFKKGGAGYDIYYGWHLGPFGQSLVMETDIGLCGLAFLDQRGMEGCEHDMLSRWPRANFIENHDRTRQWMDRIFNQPQLGKPLKLHLKGSRFQLQVWEALMRIPSGNVITYGAIAKHLDKPMGASRAVGTAVGANPISWLIPCHRVIRESGALGGYRWGLERKIAMMTTEISHDIGRGALQQ